MLYLFSGDDAKNKISCYEKFIKTVPSDAEIFFVSRNDFNRAQIESLYSGSGLFFTKSVTIFSNILEYEENRDFILEKLGSMNKSGNYFIFLEEKLNKSILEIFKKALPAGERGKPFIKIFELPKEKKEKFDSFLLANAFAGKNKFNLWLYFRQATEKGVSLEELVGVLFWKIKDLILKKDFGKFSEMELKSFAAKLSYLVPQARKESRDAEAAFERFLLEAF